MGQAKAEQRRKVRNDDSPGRLPYGGRQEEIFGPAGQSQFAAYLRKTQKLCYLNLASSCRSGEFI